MKGQMLPFVGADLLRRQEIAASAGAAFALILASLRSTGPPHPQGIAISYTGTCRMHPGAKKGGFLKEEQKETNKENEGRR
jgi:hypothetical protein